MIYTIFRSDSLSPLSRLDSALLSEMSDVSKSSPSEYTGLSASMFSHALLVAHDPFDAGLSCSELLKTVS